MLINELFASRKEIINEWLKMSLNDRLTLFFKEKGYHKIGRGEFSNVYTSKSGVIKVYRDDQPYERFLALVAKHPNPHFPKVLQSPKPLKGTSLKFVRLERLYELNAKNEKIFEEALGDIYDDNDAKGFISRYPKYADLAEAILLIYAMPGENSDMHVYNAMQRPDNTIVIIDPVGPPSRRDMHGPTPAHVHRGNLP